MRNRHASLSVMRRHNHASSTEEISELFRQSDEAVREFIEDMDNSPVSRALRRKRVVREEEALSPHQPSDRSNDNYAKRITRDAN
jgi:hypothetical protein